ncbi:MAG: A24 family peptidase [Acidimicrobiales bacterium]|nr:A24 family peptidase [Acidimicrobiales bacterium]
MTAADIAVAVVAALAAFLIAPYAQRLIDSVPPDPEDDPPPVPRAGPWLAKGPRLGLFLAVVAGAVALRFGAEPATAAHVVTAVGLTVLSVIDFDLFLLPKRIVWPLAGATLVLLGIAALVDGSSVELKQAVIGGTAAFTAMCVLAFITPGGMGFGDVRLAALIGLDLGWLGLQQVLFGLFAGFFFGAVIGLLLIAIGKRGRKDYVPFGPFMALGALFIVMGGDALLGVSGG